MLANNGTSLLYLQLADWYEREGNVPTRDQFLLLAAHAAWNTGRHQEAELLWHQLVHSRPGRGVSGLPSALGAGLPMPPTPLGPQRGQDDCITHSLLRQFASFQAAMNSQVVQEHTAELCQNYPPMLAEQMLELLGTDTSPPKNTEMEPAPAKVSQLDQESMPVTSPRTVAETLRVYRISEIDENLSEQTPVLDAGLPPAPPADVSSVGRRAPASGAYGGRTPREGSGLPVRAQHPPLAPASAQSPARHNGSARARPRPASRSAPAQLLVRCTLLDHAERICPTSGVGCWLCPMRGPLTPTMVTMIP